MSTMSTNPYIGPRTFQKNEGHLFYGREREARDLIALVASERLVVFYAQSGAGKSSIVNTRLIPNLETKEYEVLPVGRIGGDSAASIDVENIYVYNLLRSLEQHETLPVVLAKLSLSEYFAHLNVDENGFFYDSKPIEAIQEGDHVEVVRRALVIDQFEELFSTHPEAWEKRDDFFQQLAKAMEDDPYLWVVLVMREDYIASLDPYAHYVENGLRVRYYMQRLERESALKAVTSPVDELRPYAKGVAEKLIDDLCSIAVLKPDGTPDVQPGQYVEPVQLQVVCYGLWNNLSSKGKQITEEDLKKVGDVSQSLGKHYDRRVSEVAKAKKVKERLIREWFEKKLITAGGIRNMVLQEHESKPGVLDDDVIEALQSDLVRGEKRGGATWYELTHDRLVDPILQSNKIWFEEHLSPLQRQAELWNEKNRQESWLLSGRALIDVEVWAGTHQDELTNTEKLFLEACRKLQVQIKEKQDADRQQLEMANNLAAEQARSAKIARQGNIFAGIAVVLVLIALFFANNARIEAREAEEDALIQSNIARSSELSTIAVERSSSELGLALLLGVEADSVDSNSQTRKTLLALLQKSNRYKGTIATEDDIERIRYSPDGRIFASLDKNGITFWDAETRTALNKKPINGHFSGISALALNKAGTILASGATDGTIRIWDAVTREPLSEPVKAHSNEISSLAFSVDGKTLASASQFDAALILWDVTQPADPQKIGDPLLKHQYGITSIAFSPDGKTLATGGYSEVILWDVATRKDIGKPIAEHSDWVTKLTFNSDSTLLASASYDSKVILENVTDPAKPSKISELPNETDSGVRELAISSNDKMLASGNWDGSIILWDISKPENSEIIDEAFNQNTGENSYINLAFSTDNKTLASSTNYGTIVLWDVTSHARISEYQSGSSTISALIFAPDKKTLISGSRDSTISYWDISDRKNPGKIGKQLQVQEGHPSQPYEMRFSADGSLLTSYGNNSVILLDVTTQTPIGIDDILVSPEGDILVYQTLLDKTSGERAIHLMNAETNELLGDPIPGQHPFFSPDGLVLVYETIDQDPGKSLINLWDISKGENTGKGIEGSSPFFSPDNQILIYSTINPESDLSYINLWDIAKAKNIGEEIDGSYLAMSSDDRILVYQTYDPDAEQYFLNLWDITKAQNIGGAIEGEYLAISSDNQMLVYRTSDPDTGQRFIKFWDVVTAKEAGTAVEGDFISFNSEGKTLVIQTYDPETGNYMINLVDAGTRIPFRTIPGNYQNSSANGKILLYASYDEKGQFVGVLNTSTGDDIIQPVYGNFNNFIESGQTVAYEIYDYASGKYKIVLIDTVTASEKGQINGSGLNLTADGKYLIYGPDDGSGSSINLWYLTRSYNVAGPLTGRYIDLVNDNNILVYESVDRDVVNVNLFDITKREKIGEPIKGTFLDISPDGKTLVTRNENNTVVFWDVTRTWPLGEPLTEEKDNVSSAVLSTDGNTLAYAAASGITLQDVTTDKVIKTLSNDHFGAVNNTSIGQNEKFLISFGEDGKVIAWDLETFQPLTEPITGSVAFFSPNERYMAVIDYVENTSVVWDLTSQEAVAETFNGQNVVFSPRERYIAVIDSVENKSVVWDLTSQEAVAETFNGQNVVFSPDETYVAIVDGLENIIMLWDLTKREAVGDPFTGQSASFSQDGKKLAIGNETDNTVILWDIPTRTPNDIPIVGQYGVFSPEGNILAVVDGKNNTTTLWNLAIDAIIGEPLDGQYITFTQDDRTYAVTVNDYYSYPYVQNTILFDAATGQAVGEPILGIVLSSSESSDIFAIVDISENTTTFWDSKTQERIGAPISGTNSSFTGTKRNIMVVNDNLNSTTSLWDPVTRTQIGETFEGYYSFSSNPDGTLMFVVDYIKNTTVIWDLESGKQVESTIEGYYSYFSLCDDVDSKVVAWFDPDTLSVNFWDLENDLSLGEFEISEDTINYGYAVPMIFNSTCEVIAVADGFLNTTTLWDLTKKMQIGDPIEGTNAFFSADGSNVAIGGNSKGTTTFWNVANAEQVGEDLSGADITVNPQNSNILSIGTYDPNTGSYRYALWDMKSLTLIAETFNNYPSVMSDGTLIVNGSKGITFWDVDDDTPEMVERLGGHSSPIKSMLVSPNGDVLASLAADGIVLTDVDKGLSIHLETGDYTGQLTDQMAFSSDGGNFTALGSDYNIFVWDVSSESAAAKVPQQIDTPYTFAYRSALSPDGKYLIYEDGDQNLYVWDIEEEDKLGDPIKIETSGGGAVTFTPDGSSMFYNDGGAIIKWDQWFDPANSSKTELSFGQYIFTSLSIIMDTANPSNPKYLVTTNKDQSDFPITQIWDWEKNSKVGDPISGNIQIYGSNVETHVLIYRDNDGRLIKFDLNPAAWRDQLCERAGRNFTLKEWEFFLPDNIEYPSQKEDAACPQWPLDQE